MPAPAGALLFFGDDVFKRVGDLRQRDQPPGPGAIVARNLLLLDEPTNYLDIAAATGWRRRYWP